MNKMVAVAGTLVPPEVVNAMAEVNTTIPKLGNGTREQSSPEHSSKSSTIHSAFAWHRAWPGDVVSSLDIDSPLLRFSTVTVP
jgi:hypothetical protein